MKVMQMCNIFSHIESVSAELIPSLLAASLVRRPVEFTAILHVVLDDAIVLIT